MLNLLVDIVLPPVGLAMLAFVLLLLPGRRTQRGAAVTLACLVALGLPPVGTALLDTLAPPPPRPGPDPAAIVILSADGIRVLAPIDLEPGLLTLDRLTAGAALARRTGLPVLVSGGEARGAHTSLAAMMGQSLQEDFGLAARWEEQRSRDTWENAQFSAAILKPAGISRVYLVTHFWHMRRALLAFRAAGLDPVPAPVRPPEPILWRWRDALPRPSAWFESYLAFHEWVGWAYYWLR